MNVSGQKVPLKASAALGAATLVKIGTADNECTVATGVADPILGVVEFDTASGAMATVQVGGIAKVIASAAITRGDKVTGATGGKGAAAAPAAGVNNYYVGIALETAVADDWVPVLIQPGVVQG